MVTDDTYPTDDDIYHLLTAYYVDAIHIFSLILQSCTINISKDRTSLAAVTMNLVSLAAHPWWISSRVCSVLTAKISR